MSRLPRTPHRLDDIVGSRALDEQHLAMILALTSEITVLRARLDACERLLVANGTLAPGSVDAFDPDPAAQAERDEQRGRILDKVLRPMREAAQAELVKAQQQEGQ